MPLKYVKVVKRLDTFYNCSLLTIPGIFFAFTFFREKRQKGTFLPRKTRKNSTKNLLLVLPVNMMTRNFIGYLTLSPHQEMEEVHD